MKLAAMHITLRAQDSCWQLSRRAVQKAITVIYIVNENLPSALNF